MEGGAVASAAAAAAAAAFVSSHSSPPPPPLASVSDGGAATAASAASGGGVSPSTPGAPGGADPEQHPFRMEYAADVAWTVVFSFMITSAILGNLVVFWIVLGKCEGVGEGMGERLAPYERTYVYSTTTTNSYKYIRD